jgi:hypothetical protein
MFWFPKFMTPKLDDIGTSIANFGDGRKSRLARD